jgi:hypothetical protein
MKIKVIKQLDSFLQKEKFVEDLSLFYPGISDVSLKEPLSKKINSVANEFKELVISNQLNNKDFLQKIQAGLQSFEPLYLDLDTEDRERICYYFEELMDIVGLESSDGLLNQFMYDINL